VRESSSEQQAYDSCTRGAESGREDRFMEMRQCRPTSFFGKLRASNRLGDTTS